MMANTTQDSAGNALEQRQDRREETYRPRASAPSAAPEQPPTMKAPASPARMRRMVASTSANIDPVGEDFEAAPEHVDQRRKQEARKKQRGELPEQHHHDERQHRRPTAASPPRATCSPAATTAVCGAVSLICPAPDRWSRRPGSDGRKAIDFAGGIDRLISLRDVGGPLHVHAEPVIGADEFGDRLLVVGRSLGRDQLRRFVGMRGRPIRRLPCRRRRVSGSASGSSPPNRYARRRRDRECCGCR